MTKFFAVSCAVFGFTLSTLNATEVSKLLQLQTSTPIQLTHALEKQGFDLPNHSHSADGVFVVVTNTDRLLKFRKDFGLNFSIIKEVESRPYREIRSESPFDVDENYINADETLVRLQGLEKQYPEWVKVFNLTEMLGEEKTTDGNSLYAIQVSENPAQIEDEPKIAFIAQHHARELMTHHAVLDSAEMFLKAASEGEGLYTSALKNTAVWFIPVVNPDGLNYVFTDNNMWRKNRRANEGGTFGVDLNRNYEFKWGECGANSSSGWSDIYKGIKANSEPEVRVMDKLNDRLRFQYLVSLHSSGDEVLYPYVCGDLQEQELYFDIRDRLADYLDYGKRVASSSGEDFEHHYARYGTLSFLLETGSSFQPRFSTYETKVWTKIKKALPFLLEEIKAPSARIRIVNAEGEALSANLNLDELAFSEGETRTTDSFGVYRWRLSPGSYQLTVTADGYLPKTQTLAIGRTSKEYVVELERQTDLGNMFARFMSTAISRIW